MSPIIAWNPGYEHRRCVGKDVGGLAMEKKREKEEMQIKVWEGKEGRLKIQKQKREADERWA